MEDKNLPAPHWLQDALSQVGAEDQSEMKPLAEAYHAALELIEKFKDHPTFHNGWEMLDKHPFFWVNKDIDAHPYQWVTEGYCSVQGLKVYVYHKAGEDYHISLEAGGHVADEERQWGKPYTRWYGDSMLCVKARDYETGIVALAHKVVQLTDEGIDY